MIRQTSTDKDGAEPSPGSVRRSARIAVVAVLLILGATALIAIFWPKSPARTSPLYKGKPIEYWFYGTRSNFFHQAAQDSANEAINALGTNAFPFLLSNLKVNAGDGVFYFKAYRAMPAWVHRWRWLHPPILTDDVRIISLHQIRRMPRLRGDQVQALADCVPKLANPRVRMSAFNALRSNYETDPAFLPLCRILLNDGHPGIRLQAAISLAESDIVSDPREPRLFPILFDGLCSKETRTLSRQVSGYTFQQVPPGGTGYPTMRRSPGEPDQIEALRKVISNALNRLKPSLTKQQKDALDQAISKPAARKPDAN